MYYTTGEARFVLNDILSEIEGVGFRDVEDVIDEVSNINLAIVQVLGRDGAEEQITEFAQRI